MPAKAKQKAKRQPGKNRVVTTKKGIPKTRKRKPSSHPVSESEHKNDQKRLMKSKETEHPKTWFNQLITRNLWLPNHTSLQDVLKPHKRPCQRRKVARRKKRKKHKKRRKRKKREPRERTQATVPVLQSMLTSWFDVSNYTSVDHVTTWKTPQVLDIAKSLDVDYVAEAKPHAKPKQTIRKQKNKEPVNNTIRLRLYPTLAQRRKLEQMFASNRAVFNKMVARSREDCRSKLVKKKKKDDPNMAGFLTLNELAIKYRPISQSNTMAPFFKNNKRGLQRHLEVHDEVRGSAFQDYIQAVKSSRSLFFKLKVANKKTTFPELGFKSKFGRSNSIEIRPRSVTVTQKDGKEYIRFHPTFYGYERDAGGIELREMMPPIVYSIRLQRLREGEYYVCVPRRVDFQPTQATRVCAIDPGVRHFLTIYDPEGRTLSVKDASKTLLRRFKVADKLRSELKKKENECKEMYTERVRTKMKKKKRQSTLLQNTSKEHRQRYRLRRTIRYTLRRVSRMVHDLHQKVSSWLSKNYKTVLLPSFQTSEMARKHEKSVASDATPGTNLIVQQAQSKKSRELASPTVRAMMSLSHYKFKKLLEYKLERVGGRLVECEEQYTSKTCSNCGEVKDDLEGSSTFKCSSCGFVHDRDVNAAKNIFHKNIKRVVEEAA